jgi:glyoxylase-like metal-dependent hydrolase (beta-lactamase superfamily II)
MIHLTWTIGDVTITRIPEILADLPPTGLLPDATPEAVEPYREWLEPHFLRSDGQIPLSIHGLLVDTGGLRILVDTCVGPHTVPGYEAISEGAEDFLAGLADAGCAPDAVDVVLCTHMHFDHVGWNTIRDGDRFVPTFPNARYLFAREEWEHWSSAEELGAFGTTFDAAVRPIVAAGLADLVGPDHQFCESVRLVPTRGHTPGHVSVHITSQGERAFITGDMTHHPVQWAQPDWQMLSDSDSAVATATRKRVADSLLDTSVLVIGTHYAAPCAGHLVRGDRGVWFRALA